MLPNSQGQPASFCQQLVGFSIARDVACELWLPVIGVGLGVGAVVGATVPEAAVNENGHPCGAKDKVGGPTYSFEGSGRHSVAEPLGVKEPTQSHFRRGVPRAVCLHDPAASG